MTNTNSTTQLLNFLVENLIGPNNFSIDEQNQNGTIFYTLTVSDEKVGFLIGKQGKTINAIRRLLQVKAAQDNQKVFLKVISPNSQDNTDQSTNTTPETEPKVQELSELLDLEP